MYEQISNILHHYYICIVLFFNVSDYTWRACFQITKKYMSLLFHGFSSKPPFLFSQSISLLPNGCHFRFCYQVFLHFLNVTKSDKLVFTSSRIVWVAHNFSYEFVICLLLFFGSLSQLILTSLLFSPLRTMLHIQILWCYIFICNVLYWCLNPICYLPA